MINPLITNFPPQVFGDGTWSHVEYGSTNVTASSMGAAVLSQTRTTGADPALESAIDEQIAKLGTYGSSA